MRQCSFAGEFAQCLCQGVSLSGIAVLFTLLNRAFGGCANLDFSFSDQTTQRQAKNMPAQVSRHATGLSWVYNHACADAGLDRRGRVLEVYLEDILAVFSRLDHKEAPSLQRSRDT